MPIEIRELVIRAAVDQGRPGIQDRAISDQERAAIVEQAVDAVLDVLRRREEP